MQLIRNQQIAAILTMPDAIAVMRQAFLEYGRAGATQERVRIDCGATKLSMMGAIIPGLDAVGAKIYTTINGKFTFAVVLFSASSGALLAVMEGEAMTEYRTAAVTAIAADALAPKDAATLAVFGSGVQARAHVPALLSVRPFSEVLVVALDRPAAFAEEIAGRFGLRCRAATAEEAAASADVIVTATRSPAPLFDGAAVKPGAFVAAIGSSKPDAREVDEQLVRRAARIVVESRPQARSEAGDLLLCAPGAFAWDEVEQLAEVLAGAGRAPRNESGIVLYKAVGVGMEDVALAEFVHRRLGA